MASDYPNIEQKMTYADFKNLCNTYCGGKTSYDTSKVVPRCWSSSVFGSKMLGYRFKCQCVGSRESLRLEGCGVPPYYDESKGPTKTVVDKWPKLQQDGKKTNFEDFSDICKAFCTDNDDYYANRNNISGVKVTFNTSRFSILTTRRYPGHLYNCTCRRNKEERLSVSDAL